MAVADIGHEPVSGTCYEVWGSRQQSQVELLRGWGADAELIWLPDRDIDGNGHFLMFEQNSDQVLDIVVELIGVIERGDR